MINPYYYFDMLRQLDIRPGSLVVVSADVTRLALAGRRIPIGFHMDAFTDTLRQILGKGGTLVIPAFNFNLKNGQTYSPERTLPVTGAMAVAALQRPEFIRTRNPLHSFLVWGEHANALASLDNKSSFGPDSPFAYFREHHARMLLIDTSITTAFTFVHHVEEMEQVKYRRFKKIGLQVDRDGSLQKREVLLYAKKPGWTMDLSGLDHLLQEKSVAQVMKINRIMFTLVDLAAAFPIICDDIRTNKSRNIAKFSLNLFARETGKMALGALGIHTLADKISHDPGLL